MFIDRLKSLQIWKKKFIYIYMALTLLLLVGCFVMRRLDREKISYLGEYAFEPGVATEGTILYENIALKPGVYQIVLLYNTDRDYSGICSVREDTAHPRLFMTNGEHLYKGLSATSYDLWVFAPADNAIVMASYSGQGTLSTGDLMIVNTGKLWSMIGVVVFGLSMAGLISIIYVSYNRQYKVKTEIKWVAFWLMAITLLASLPQIRNSMFGGADLTYHLQRIEAVKDGLSSGQFPVRIAPNWLYGYGYADPVFYCNTFLYFPALLRMAGFTVTIAYNLFCIVLNFATAWIAWYSFGKVFKDNRIGLMCSALYTLSFIRLYKLMMVGALGEGSAVTFLPLIFYGMYRIFTEDTEDKAYKTAWLPVAFGYAGVVQCHVLTCEITAFVTLVVCIVCIRRVLKRPVFMALVKGAMGALGLSLWYLVPFADYYLTQDMHIRHVSGRTIQERGLYPVQLLVHSWSDTIRERLIEAGFTEVEPAAVGLLFILALVVFFLLWLCGRLRKENSFAGKESKAMMEPALRQTAKLSAILACVLLAMTLRIFPWDQIQNSSALMASLVSSLQFPNRFLGWSTVFLCMVFGFCVYYFRGRKGGYPVAICLTVISILTGSVYLLYNGFQEQESLTLHNEESMGCGYISGAEYLVEGTDYSLLTFTGPATEENVKISHTFKGPLQAKVSCINEYDRESYIDFPLLCYKGYQATTDTGEKLVITKGDNYQVRVILPAGFEGDVEIQFVSPFYWRIAELITMLAIVWIGICVIRYGKVEK